MSRVARRQWSPFPQKQNLLNVCHSVIVFKNSYLTWKKRIISQTNLLCQNRLHDAPVILSQKRHPWLFQENRHIVWCPMSYPPPAYFCIIWHQFLNKFRNLLWFTITPFTTIYGLILLFWIQDWLNVRLGKCKISVCLRWHHLEILGIAEFDSEMLENFSNIDLRLKWYQMHVRFYARNKILNQIRFFAMWVYETIAKVEVFSERELIAVWRVWTCEPPKMMRMGLDCKQASWCGLAL